MGIVVVIQASHPGGPGGGKERGFIEMTNDYCDNVDDGDGKKQDDGDNVDGAQVESNQVPGGVDFTGCVTDPDTGFCCVDKLEQVRNHHKVKRSDKLGTGEE